MRYMAVPFLQFAIAATAVESSISAICNRCTCYWEFVASCPSGVAAETMEFYEDVKIRMVVNSDAEAFQVCNAYAIRKGFNLRKGHIRRDKSNNIIQ
ncbi:hypothetical protein DVH24_018906 [Malus domestica]|uniref:Uncharacterized protein n=1 Tax=Malus domestica TaxID=3750 RepID=A0A498HQX8_MALDO|nr:hypothetical protein DVH24_018906 [Malus domestica]